MYNHFKYEQAYLKPCSYSMLNLISYYSLLTILTNNLKLRYTVINKIVHRSIRASCSTKSDAVGLQSLKQETIISTSQFKNGETLTLLCKQTLVTRLFTDWTGTHVGFGHSCVWIFFTSVVQAYLVYLKFRLL